MMAFIARRVLIMIPTLFVISIITFVIIQLPPGDYLTTLAANLAQSGETADEALLSSLRAQYGLDKPFYVQYLKWISGVVVGDFGQSFTLNKPVNELIWEKLGITVAVTFVAILFTWIIALPIGIYSATHQYKFSDNLFTLLGFIGISTPPFSLALLLMWASFQYFHANVGGLFSEQFVNAPWSWAKVLDFLEHIWIPVFLLSIEGTAGLIRQVRANLLDQLEMPYVVTARAKGLSEWRLLLKYPVRLAINPLVSTVGWMLPQLVSGSVIVAMVLGLPMTGPMFLRALMEQDMYLAGSFVMLLSVLTVVGTLISDILLAWLDPRIRYGRTTS
ncbi:MAG TPA: ABC transporter permease [Candidatus Hydrogenedentes bacterium]|nr:ABC transporter permease [Candidatus Hydrogenedentota bacterium]HOL76140.1 ABC transporter permease [Candidatus Hydrogenedentota bacterium]HPO84754.1 ABC transporter permease [Candidatus Hydrogenedentota bacterium]